jgi:hypothetical protein
MIDFGQNMIYIQAKNNSLLVTLAENTEAVPRCKKKANRGGLS